MILTLGKNDQIKSGDIAKFYFLEKPKFKEYLKKPMIREFAQARVIKVEKGYSYWYLEKIRKPEMLKIGMRLNLAVMQKVLSGRSKLTFHRKEMVLNENDSKRKDK